VWADYEKWQPGGDKRKEILKGLGKRFLGTVPGATESSGEYTLRIPGAAVTPPPQAKVGAGGLWFVKLDGKTWVPAGEAYSTYGGTDPVRQRYNYVLTVLGELNRGVSYAPNRPPFTPRP
jgi:hypothetical protein